MVTRPSSRKALPGGAATRCGPVSTAGGRGGQGELATAERRHGPLTLPLRGPLPLPRGEREIYLLSHRVTFSPGGRGLRRLGEAEPSLGGAGGGGSPSLRAEQAHQAAGSGGGGGRTDARSVGKGWGRRWRTGCAATTI